MAQHLPAWDLRMTFWLLILGFVVALGVGSWWMYRTPNTGPHDHRIGDGSAIDMTETGAHEALRATAVHIFRSGR